MEMGICNINCWNSLNGTPQRLVCIISSRTSCPYAILAIVVLCALVILPITILALYPFAFFQKFLNLFPVRWYVLHTFVDAFQGCYKDGTEPGTRDFRWFSAVYLSFRCVAFLYSGLLRMVNISLCVPF
jgi:hypothetical protein